MVPLYETSSEVDELVKKARRCLLELSQKISFSQSLTLLPHQIFKPASNIVLSIVEEGILTLSKSAEVLFLFEKGDGLCLKTFQSNTSAMQFQAKDLQVKLSLLEEKDFKRILEDAELCEIWSRWNELQLALRFQLLLPLLKKEEAFAPEIKVFGPGEVIVREGDRSNEVYTLLAS